MSVTLFLTLLTTLTPHTGGKRVAVIEYRAGVAEQSDLTKRVVSLLRDKSNVEVVTSDDGRRMLGTRFDLMVSKCKASPYCVSRLGKKLKVQEVLLIALTEFGNVIISMSRIIVNEAQSKGSADLDVQVGGRVTKIQIFKMLKKVFPKGYFKQWGKLKILSNITGAGVTLNDKTVGKTPLAPLKLPAPKKYRIKVTKEGYVPFRAAVDLLPRGNLSIDAQLSPKGKSVQPQWYQKWWFWTAVGATLISAAATTWYFTRPVSSVPLTVAIP